ncbi:MAG: helix-turn-helix domain-containing protein, partial [Microbacteriaceae bacterium]
MNEKSPASKKNRDGLRLRAAQEALRLFEEQGFENTSVDEIAQNSGVSRRTLFRQFGSKEDIIFADHEMLLQEIIEHLHADTTNPWDAVLDSARKVFDHFYRQQEFSQHRYRVVRAVPVLRAREIVTVFRYEQLYSE